MSFQLRDHVSFCVAEGRVIFLDTRRDRYFCLSPSAQLAFVDLTQGAKPDAARAAALKPMLDAGILIPGASPIIPSAAPTRIARSASDEWSGGAGLIATARMIAAQSLWRSIFRRWGLQGAIDRIRPLKERAAKSVDNDAALGERRVIGGFLMAGRLFGSRDQCLLRSFTLSASLAKGGTAVDLVFGVRASPFGAHCWAQQGDLVLNDSVDHARQFTPILVL